MLEIKGCVYYKSLTNRIGKLNYAFVGALGVAHQI